LTSNGICAGGFARSDPRLERPDIQLNFSVWSFADRNRAGVVPHPFPLHHQPRCTCGRRRAARSG